MNKNSKQKKTIEQPVRKANKSTFGGQGVAVGGGGDDDYRQVICLINI